jgi:cystathionine beta-lyase
VPAPLGPGPRLDLEALDLAFGTEGVQAFLLCNPHNPTGLVLEPEELTAIADLAETRGVRLIADEIHGPLVYAGRRHTPLATIARAAAAEAPIVTSASKAWNLPGLKAALLHAPEPVLRALPEQLGWGTGLFGILAGEAAFTDGEPWLDELLGALQQNRDMLSAIFTAKLPAVGYVPPAATYLAWLDLRGLDLGDDPAVPLLERGRLAVSRGLDFGPEGAGHVRLNFATRPSILKEAIRRLSTTIS